MEFDLYTIKKKGLFLKKYEILQDGEVVYNVSGKPFNFLRSLQIYDRNGLEVMQVKRPFIPFKMIFRLMSYMDVVAEIKREFGPFKNNLLVTSKFGDYYVNGNFMKDDFTISKGPEEIAKISRQRSFKGDSYGIAISQDENKLFILGLTMTLELMIRVMRSRKS